jgi:hypothetical protein
MVITTVFNNLAAALSTAFSARVTSIFTVFQKLFLGRGSWKYEKGER